ncbi:MAG: DUF5004 domain-containing protein [Ferruginibacter sp.]
MKSTILYLLFFFATSAKAQTSNSLVGDWKFKSIKGTENLDSTKKAKMQELFGKIEFNFKEDKSYIATFEKEERGVWQYNERTKILTTRREDKNGKEKSITVITVTGNDLVLELKKGMQITLERKQK